MLPGGRSFLPFGGIPVRIDTAEFSPHIRVCVYIYIYIHIYIYIYIYIHTCVSTRERVTERKKRVGLGVIDTKPLKRRETLGNEIRTRTVSRGFPCWILAHGSRTNSRLSLTGNVPRRALIHACAYAHAIHVAFQRFPPTSGHNSPAF